MILTSKISSLAFLFFILVTEFSLAQGTVSQTLSVSPTLIEMQAEKGQSWQSEIRIINVNDYDLTVYPQVVNFAPLGEDGRGDLIPVMESESTGHTLAEWITVSEEAVVIKAQQTTTIPLQVSVPGDASPGGHYAAVLIGTKPPVSDTSVSKVQTAQFVSSLFFVRVAGDVVEKGDIREFRSANNISQTPIVTLEMRFENNGNVHVQPQGDIKIFNMWGEERGLIPINHQTHFGNVLPQSIRKFSFTWSGEGSTFDIGRYKAVATLGYGNEVKQFVTSTTYFWIIPYTTIAFTLITLIIVFKLALWLVRRYIERMLILSGIPLDSKPYVPIHQRNFADNNTVVIHKNYQTVSAPVRAGVREIASSWMSAPTLKSKLLSLIKLTHKYYLVFVAIATVVVIVVIVFLLYSAFTASQRQYEVSISTPGADVLLTSEEIAYEQLRQSLSIEPSTIATPRIDVVNASGALGLGAETRIALERAGYLVTDLTTDNTRQDAKTIIVYNHKDQALVLEISKVLKNALLSARVDSSDDTIVIYAGRDTQIK